MSDQPELKMVRDRETGAVFPVARWDRAHYEVLDEPGRDAAGNPMPARFEKSDAQIARAEAKAAEAAEAEKTAKAADKSGGGR